MGQYYLIQAFDHQRENNIARMTVRITLLV
jgi:hypothetical protein